MEFVLEVPTPGGGRGRGGRAGEPVRRHSRPQGRVEAVFWRPFRPKDVARHLLAAERFERAGKKPGKRTGPLGAVALEVLRELLRLVDYRTGRLEPALTTLMARTRRSKDAVVRALSALRARLRRLGAPLRGHRRDGPRPAGAAGLQRLPPGAAARGRAPARPGGGGRAPA